jgi:hypothetical protein
MCFLYSCFVRDVSGVERQTHHLRFMHCVGSKFSYSCLVRAVSGVERQTHHFAFHALCFIHALLFKLCT